MSTNVSFRGAVIFLGALVIPQVSYGAPIGYGDLTLEMMMEVQLQDQLLVQATIPWNPTDALTYSYVYNTSTGAFSFSTISGQSIAGLPFSFSMTAQLDAVQGAWSWSGTGLAGGMSFEIAGDGNAILDDPATEEVKGKYHDDNGNEYDASATVTIDTTETGKKSSGTGKATDKKGNVVKSGKVKDFIALQNPKGAAWEITFLDDAPGVKQPFDAGLDTSIGPTEFQGYFIQTSVPEPSTFSLLGCFGVVGLIGCLRSRRHRRTMAESLALRS